MSEENLFSHLRRLIDEGIDPVSREQEIHEQYGRHVSVLVLDSVGFSRISEERGIVHYLTRLMQMRDVVQPILNHHEALSSTFEADNAFAVFADANRAVCAAHAIHVAIDTSGLMLTDTEAFQCCIGVGSGRLLYSQTLEGYFGEEMNLASKLGEDVAEGGETLITAATYQILSDDLRGHYVSEQQSIAGIDLTYYRNSGIL
ncbi:MAG: adenylate/guanylate cyclase domain-containing protein [Pseudomonadota bacterium]